MKRMLPVTTLFLDVGGVLLTNGWDHLARKRAARNFNLNWAEMDERHRLVFETHEEGKLTFQEYLGWVVFYEKRSIHAGPVSGLHVRSIEAFPQDDRTHHSTQATASFEDRRGQQ